MSMLEVIAAPGQAAARMSRQGNHSGLVSLVEWLEGSTT